VPIMTTAISGSSGDIALTGSVTAAGMLSSYGLGNSATISAAVSTATNHNYMLYGPITVADGSSFTIGVDSIVKIKNLVDA
jgi:hypothetical protein